MGRKGRLGRFLAHISSPTGKFFRCKSCLCLVPFDGPPPQIFRQLYLVLKNRPNRPNSPASRCSSTSFVRSGVQNGDAGGCAELTRIWQARRVALVSAEARDSTARPHADLSRTLDRFLRLSSRGGRDVACGRVGELVVARRRARKHGRESSSRHSTSVIRRWFIRHYPFVRNALVI